MLLITKFVSFFWIKYISVFSCLLFFIFHAMDFSYFLHLFLYHAYTKKDKKDKASLNQRSIKWYQCQSNEVNASLWNKTKHAKVNWLKQKKGKSQSTFIWSDAIFSISNWHQENVNYQILSDIWVPLGQHRNTRKNVLALVYHYKCKIHSWENIMCSFTHSFTGSAC